MKFTTVLIAFTLPLAAGEKDFTTLFDGSSLDGWTQSGNWEITDDGALYRKRTGGSIRYTAEKVPDDFELRFEWKVSEGANSGVYYRPGQYEYQILDNAKHADGKNPRTSAASLYFCMAPRKDLTKPVGEWNTARIVGKGTIIQHWLNGEKAVAFDYSDPKWSDQVALLKLRGAELTERGANLSLQDHGDPVWYRNIRIREIPAEEEIDATQVEPGRLSPSMLYNERKKIDRMMKAKAEKAAAKN